MDLSLFLWEQGISLFEAQEDQKRTLLSTPQLALICIGFDNG